MDASTRHRQLRPRGSFQTPVSRRHVDLLRVSSALCPAAPEVR